MEKKGNSAMSNLVSNGSASTDADDEFFDALEHVDVAVRCESEVNSSIYHPKIEASAKQMAAPEPPANREGSASEAGESAGSLGNGGSGPALERPPALERIVSPVDSGTTTPRCGTVDTPSPPSLPARMQPPPLPPRPRSPRSAAVATAAAPAGVSSNATPSDASAASSPALNTPTPPPPLPPAPPPREHGALFNASNGVSHSATAQQPLTGKEAGASASHGDGSNAHGGSVNREVAGAAADGGGGGGTSASAAAAAGDSSGDDEAELSDRMRFRVVNKDTGEVFDLSEIEQHMPPDLYSTALLPSREDLMEKRRSMGETNSPGGASSATTASASAASPPGDRPHESSPKSGRRQLATAMTQLRRLGKPREKTRLDPNAIRVSVSRKDSSEFSGLMLLQELRVHAGPVYSMAFSHGGDYLAAAGDYLGGPGGVGSTGGNVFLYRVAPTQQQATSSSGASSPATGGAAADLAAGRPSAAAAASSAGAAGASANGPDMAAGGVSAFADAGAGGAEAGSSGGGGGGGGASSGGRRPASGAPSLGLLEETPMRVYSGHRGAVIDLCWSENDFLLTASMDSSVRLWHPTHSNCLQEFIHTSAVTGVDFFPRSEDFFVSGCCDCKLRVWSVRDPRVREWARAPDPVTAVRFSPDGALIVAGLTRGQVLFYLTEGMRYYTQIECRNRQGPNRRGRNVIGLAFREKGEADGDSSSAAAAAAGAAKRAARSPGARVARDDVLVTTNDSRLRLYQTDDFRMVGKYKGLTNDSLPIKASFSEDGRYVITGSDNGKAFIWNTVDPKAATPTGIGMAAAAAGKETNKCFESFVVTTAAPAIVLSALFVPEAAVRACVASIRGCSPAALAGDYANAMVAAVDYEGVLRIYAQMNALLK